MKAKERAAQRQRLEEWKGVTERELVAGAKDQANRILAIARSSENAVGGHSLDLNALQNGPAQARQLFADLEQWLESWERAHPQGSVPYELISVAEQARAAIDDMPSIQLLATKPAVPSTFEGPDDYVNPLLKA